MMLGAGLFAALGAATDEAGTWVLLSWAVAGVLAACCATSSIRLAAVAPSTPTPRSERPRTRLGHLSRWAGLLGKGGACGVLVLTIWEYLLPDTNLWLAGAVAVCVLAIHWFSTSNLPNLFIRDLDGRNVGRRDLSENAPAAPEPTATESDATVPNATEPAPANIPAIVFNRFLVAFVLFVLAFVFFAAAASRQADPANLSLNNFAGWKLLPAAGLLFFAFGGYGFGIDLGRPGPDSRAKSQRNIIWATAAALSVLVCVTILVSAALLSSTPADDLGRSDSPLAVAADIGGFNRLSGLIRLTAAVACLGVLMPLLKSFQRDVSRAVAGLGRSAGSRSSASIAYVPKILVAASLILPVLVVGTRTLLAFAVFCLLLTGAADCTRAMGLARKPARPPRDNIWQNQVRSGLQLPTKPLSARQQRRLDARLARTYGRTQTLAEWLVRAAAAVGSVGCLALAFSLLFLD